jgi:hypothetical protein
MLIITITRQIPTANSDNRKLRPNARGTEDVVESVTEMTRRSKVSRDAVGPSNACLPVWHLKL